MIFSTLESYKKFLKFRMTSKYMYVKCSTSVGLSKDISYKVVRCVKQFLITKMRYPPLIAQFGTRFFIFKVALSAQKCHFKCLETTVEILSLSPVDTFKYPG